MRASRLMVPVVTGLMSASGVPADQMSEAREICTFFEASGLQGSCTLNPLRTQIEITLTGFYDNPPECPKIADMLRSFQFVPGRDWELVIHARIKDEPTAIECELLSKAH